MKIIKKNAIFLVSALFLLSFLIILPLKALPEDPPSSPSTPINTNNQAPASNPMLGKIEKIAKDGGYVVDREQASVPRIVGLVINTFTSILGVIFVILIVMAGFTWMTSAGNEEKIKKAGATIKSATFGLVLTLSAWIIWKFIFDNLIKG